MRKSYTIRVYIYVLLNVLLVFYSYFYGYTAHEFYLRHNPWGKPMPTFSQCAYDYWYLGFLIPLLSLASLKFRHRFGIVFYRILPDLLLLHAVVWMISVHFAWEMTRLPVIRIQMSQPESM